MANKSAKYVNRDKKGFHLFWFKLRFHFQEEWLTFLKVTRLSLSLSVNLTVDLFALIPMLETVIVLFPKFWWITCSSNHKRLWIANPLHAVQLPRPLGDKVLRLVSAIFYHFFIFSTNDSPANNSEKCFLFHLKNSFCSWDIQIFLIFTLPFLTFQIQKNKWKWNNLCCHELAWINLQV